MSKTHSLKMKALSLLVAVALAVAALPLAGMPALAATVPNRMFIHPATQTVDPGYTFTVQVRMDTNLTTTGAQTCISFNQTLVQVTGVTVGNMYVGGMLIHGSIAEANIDGSLNGVAMAMLVGDQPPITGGTFVNIAMKAQAGVVGTQTSPLTLSGVLVTDLAGNLVPMALVHGNVIVAGPVPPMPDLIVSAKSEAFIDGGPAYNVTFTVTNQGTAGAIASTAAIVIDGIEVDTEAIPALAVGASATRIVGPFTLIGTSDTIVVTADSGAVVAESNEANNSLTNILHGLADDGATVVTSPVPAGFVSISVPAALAFSLVRGVMNNVTLPVTITSDTVWQLNVEDKKPLPNRGYMVSAAGDVLEYSMSVSWAYARDLRWGGLLGAGAGSIVANSTLWQHVAYSDVPGAYAITVTFAVVGSF